MNSPRSRMLAALSVASLALCFSAPGIDLNGNGMSDVWEQKFDVVGLLQNGDADGDGVSNAQESLAGTDPYDNESYPLISGISASPTNVLVRLKTEAGKYYQLQRAPALGSNWITDSGLLATATGETEISSAAHDTTGFFRVAISDVDTDGDGANDWEEYQAGLSPNNPNSNGQLDSEGRPKSDLDYITGQLQSPNIINAEATVVAAYQPNPGDPPGNPAHIMIRRSGLALNTISVNLLPAPPQPGVGTESVDFSPLPRAILFEPGVRSLTIPIVPLPNTNRTGPVLATLQVLSWTQSSGTAPYTVGQASNASVVIYPSSSPQGVGLTGSYYTNASTTYSSTANFNPANLKLTRVDPGVNFSWGTNTLPITNNGYYCVRWAGQVQPQSSETYYFVANTDDGVKLWVDDQLIINNWIARVAADSVGKISLSGGVRYNIRMEYFQVTGPASARLYWYSASQPKQIIPANRLYPSETVSPPVITSDSTAVAFVGQLFTFKVTAARSPAVFAANNLPPGLAFDAANAMISGIPQAAGKFQIQLTAANAAGVGSSVLTLEVIQPASRVSRDLWLGVPGTSVEDIPISSAPSSTSFFSGLQGVTGFGADYGERVRGFITAPQTGNYYFWLAAADSAELWISNDSEPVSKVLRAQVRNGTGNQQWDAEPGQRSAWLSLIAGQKYYVEVLHKAGSSTNDHWSVAWRFDPTGTNAAPAELVPPYTLSPHFPTPQSFLPGTLYTANMVPQPGAAATGIGSATLRINAENTQAVLKFNYSGLSSPVTGQHIHSDPYLNHSGQVIFDIDEAPEQPDGSRIWELAPLGTLSVADILEIIRQGRAYVNVHTANFPGGEIKGYFTLASGTQTFAPPPAMPSWTDDHSSSNAAARFLTQATFGATPAEITAVQALGYAGWISNQFALPPTYHLPFVLQNVSYDLTRLYPGSRAINSWWKNSVTAPDQLRQRVAFALSEIMVVSQAGVLADRATALSDYYDMLLDHAFGNFRELLEAVTLHPAMGIYLDMRANQKGDLATGLHPNENYAREILQLFSIGLYRMWPDGTLALDSSDAIVPTYSQDEIIGFANVFTGWNYYQALQSNGRLPTGFSPGSNYTNSMVLVPLRHELGAKRVLNNVILPPASGAQTNSANVDFDTYCLNDLELALDSIYRHENVGPFICRQLIQRLVTSNPTRDYVYRVVQAFNDDGTGLRGNMQAVIQAILLDYEARGQDLLAQPGYGKLREPVLRVTAAARAFPAPAPSTGAYSQSGNRTITCATPGAHRLNSGDTVQISFTDTSGQPAPASTRYAITPTGPNSFTVNDGALPSGTYSQVPNSAITNAITGELITTNVIYVNLTGHGLSPGLPVYILFSSGGASNGQYLAISATNANNFAVATADSAARSGSCRIFKLTGSYSQAATTITISINGNHGLAAGAPVYINFTSGSAPDGHYNVSSVLNGSKFTVTSGTSVTRSGNSLTVFPLAAPPVVRSGTIVMEYSTWNVGGTDSSLGQTPLGSPTVFNFFSPDYKYPGVLAAAGLTTPEFQLMSDTEAANQMNYLANGVLGNASNTNGLTSFTAGDGDIVVDLGPWMTPAYTGNTTALGNLFDALNALLAAGRLPSTAKNTIVSYAATLPYTTPTYGQMRDRVRAVAHLILVSPDFTIQR